MSLLLLSSALFGVMLAVAAVMPTYLLFGLVLVVVGVATQTFTTSANSTVQLATDPAMRGRVISYFAMAYFGMMPLGGLLIGAVSQYAGAPETVLGSGIMALILLAIFWRYLSTPAKGGNSTDAAGAPHAANTAGEAGVTRETAAA